MKLLLILLLTSLSATARDQSQVREFRKDHPCPITGKTKGACPGYVVDHRIGLCVNGPDDPSNMQWMEKADAKAKDKWECKIGWEKKLIESECSCSTLPHWAHHE